MSEEGDWKQHDMMAATIRHGLELLLKLNVFYYAVTGAMLSFYLSRPAPVPWAFRLALAVPVLRDRCECDLRAERVVDALRGARNHSDRETSWLERMA